MSKFLMNTVFRSIPFVLAVFLTFQVVAAQTFEKEQARVQEEEQPAINTEQADRVEEEGSDEEMGLAESEQGPGAGEQESLIQQLAKVEEEPTMAQESAEVKPSIFGRRSVFEQELLTEKDKEAPSETQLNLVEDRLAVLGEEVIQLKEKTHFLEDQLKRSRQRKKKGGENSLRYGWTAEQVLTSVGPPWKTYGYVKDGKHFEHWLYSEFDWHRYQNVLFEDGKVVGWNLPDSVKQQLEMEAAVEFLEQIEE